MFEMACAIALYRITELIAPIDWTLGSDIITVVEIGLTLKILEFSYNSQHFNWNAYLVSRSYCM